MEKASASYGFVVEFAVNRGQCLETNALAVCYGYKTNGYVVIDKVVVHGSSKSGINKTNQHTDRTGIGLFNNYGHHHNGSHAHYIKSSHESSSAITSSHIDLEILDYTMRSLTDGPCDKEQRVARGY